ncbi:MULTISPECIES: division/cell wall cluster transcriptional repressor MraZ [Reichenbachiella]|uniref:Transcriptional regulator MraZ n=1 Tax=Reichenbachiella agariperforans TaxID=156994 RepID=A0A1M6LKB0_REIAG|nr:MULTISPECIES: division/cell wall cluster transcriptional repressor MraZ [Reichenbachiella]MBU2913958.1 division/cell wall cluster transcriptional repressor MraZ [Reichenbachiella agariperforans]RJE74133.1 division/cell wall cluster transcriptional repressor MraZ [Reichenbachiella sp. MSK19-1]SHJ71647.1 MraZ protein [Reichenbachiella agariperforans]
MAFFTSEYECKLDAKGRLALPAKIKANLPEVSGNELVVMKGFDPNLVVYTMLEFKKIQSKFASLSDFDTDQRRLKRNFFRSVAPVELDSAGRFLIPKAWIDHAKLEKNVTVIGTGSTVEIWNPDLYDDYLIADSEEYSDLAKKFLDE